MLNTYSFRPFLFSVLECDLAKIIAELIGVEGGFGLSVYGDIFRSVHGCLQSAAVCSIYTVISVGLCYNAPGCSNISFIFNCSFLGTVQIEYFFGCL